MLEASLKDCVRPGQDQQVHSGMAPLGKWLAACRRIPRSGTTPHLETGHILAFPLPLIRNSEGLKRNLSDGGFGSLAVAHAPSSDGAVFASGAVLEEQPEGGGASEGLWLPSDATPLGGGGQ